MSYPKLRPARPQDLPALKSMVLATELFPTSYVDSLFSDDPHLIADKAFWLTYDDEGVKAVACCAPEYLTRGTWKLRLIAVQSDHQRQGIGREIMQHIETKLRSMGARHLLLEISSTEAFAQSRAFYQHLRYHREAQIRDYYDSKDDMIIYRKSVYTLADNHGCERNLTTSHRSAETLVT